MQPYLYVSEVNQAARFLLKVAPAINTFLRREKPDVIDIKYQQTYDAESDMMLYSAMVVFDKVHNFQR